MVQSRPCRPGRPTPAPTPTSSFGRQRETRPPPRSPAAAGSWSRPATTPEALPSAPRRRCSTRRAGQRHAQPAAASIPSEARADYDALERPITNASTPWAPCNGPRPRSTRATGPSSPAARGATSTFTDAYDRPTKIENYTTAPPTNDTTTPHLPGRPSEGHDHRRRRQDTATTANLAGQIVQTDDANAGTSTATYDETATLRVRRPAVRSSRPRRARPPDAADAEAPGGSAATSATWAYDTVAGGVGQLASTTSDAGVRDSLTVTVRCWATTSLPPDLDQTTLPTNTALLEGCPGSPTPAPRRSTRPECCDRVLPAIAVPARPRPWLLLHDRVPTPSACPVRVR